jgi:diaminohydroxyphosphoribosylaminopyrimidine deaminase / 5-amino-6-(5-phosphoribosylamino)uracil reductase
MDPGGAVTSVGTDCGAATAWSRLLALAHGDGVPMFNAPGDETVPRSLYAPIACGGAVVVGQLGQSLDGRIATPAGHSHYVNGPAAIRHLHRLRALVDAAIVGIGTVLADDPRLTVREVAGPSPARVVIDPSGRLPAGAKLLADDGVPRFIVQATGGPPRAGVTTIEVPRRDGRLDPHAIVAALAERGLCRLLVEGGGRTVSTFLAAGALDRLHLCVAPLIIGSGPLGLALPRIDHLDDALRPAVTMHRLGEDVLFDCVLR